MTFDVYSQRQYAKYVEMVQKGVERLKYCPHLNVKDEESLINWFMCIVINARAFVRGPTEINSKIFSQKYIPPIIRKVFRELKNDGISFKDAESRLEQIIDIYETGVLLLDYSCGPIDKYMKIEPQNLNQKSHVTFKKLSKRR